MSPFQSIVESIASAVFIFQGDAMRYVNPSAQTITGYSREKLLAMPFWAIIHEDFQDMVKQRGRARQSGDDAPASYEVKIVRKDGEARWVNFSVGMIELDGKPAVMGMAEDITGRKLAEKQARLQASRMHALRQALEMLNRADSVEEVYEFAVQGAMQVLGCGRASILAFGADHRVHFVAWHGLSEGYRKAVDGHCPWQQHETDAEPICMPDIAKADLPEDLRAIILGEGVRGAAFFPLAASDCLLGKYMAYFDQPRELSGEEINLGTILAANLVTALNRLENVKQLNLSERRLALAMEASSDGLWDRNIQTGEAYFSPRWETMLGYDTGEIEPDVSSWKKLVHPEDADDVMAALAEHLEGRSDQYVAEYRMRAKDGSWLWVLGRGKVVERDADGRPVRITGTHTDITERRQNEDALRESEQRYQKLVDTIPDAILVHCNGEIVYANPAAAQVFALSDVQEAYGKKILDFVHPDSREMVIRRMQRVFQEGQSAPLAEEKLIRMDGQVIDAEVTALPTSYQGEPAIQVVLRDITARTLAQQELRESERRHRKLSQAVSQSGASIMITDKNGVIEYVNPAFEKITGYSAEDVIGKTPGILKSSYQDAAFYEDMWRTITSGDVWYGKVIDRRKGGISFPAMLTIAPIVDDDGSVTHFVGSHADISELEEIEQQFRQAQKMEALGTLVGGIAHDFNNMLAGMTGNLFLAKKKLQAQPDVLQKLTNIEALSFRAADMIQQLLTFARKSMVSMKPMPLTPFIKETMKLLRSSVPESIKMQQEICSEYLIVNGDSTQLHQVLMNLVTNARDALEEADNPCMTIRLEAFHADDAFIDTHPYFTTGLYAHLSVEDNGCGIPKHQVEHLFEPFFTTKEQGKGTGLGLAMVFGAVKTHHGFVELESIDGKGSTFHIYLPLLVPGDIVSTSAQGDKVTEGHGELILLVDDEQHIIKTGKEVLELLGYRALTAENGWQAVELFKAHAEEIDLCILDVVMPVMGGGEAAQSIRRINPDIKVIFSTGYDKNIQTGMEHETVLNKPFSIVEMSHLIRRHLSG